MTKLFRRVLVPHDFSEAATAALRVAADLAEDAGGRLTVLHVLGSGGRTRARSGAARMAECRAVSGDPLQCVLAAARRVDSIVMATVGRTGLAHVLIGSVAEKVVRHAPVPVLTIRPSVRTRRRAPGARWRRRPSARRPA